MIGILKVQPHVRSVIDDDGALLLDLRVGVYYSLNGIGAEIWRAAEAGASLPEIHTELIGRYDVPAARLENDVESFVRSMKHKELIHVEP